MILPGTPIARGERVMRTRFAPSPTGDLHLGGAYVALASWHMARRKKGTIVVRMEDLDTPRVLRGSAARILEDLRWLGLAWDELTLQSDRTAAYEAALAGLADRGLTYPCDCSRAEIVRSASAPHAGEESVYPGTCRAKKPERPMKRSAAIRLKIPAGTVVTLRDEIQGTVTQDLARDVGDFVLQRGDGIYAYQLAVLVDDAASRVSDVVRGADLLLSTPRQIHLATLLGAAAPRYWHLPLVVDAHGERIAKRTHGARVRALREAGVSREEILGELAFALGLTKRAAPASLEELIACPWAPAPPREGWRIPAKWAATST